MNAALLAVLAFIEQILPKLVTTDAPLITSIINILVNWLPIIVSEAETLYQPVKNIITALMTHGAVTADQKAALQALDAKMDAAFEAAAEGIDPDAGDA